MFKIMRHHLHTRYSQDSLSSRHMCALLLLRRVRQTVMDGLLVQIELAYANSAIAILNQLNTNNGRGGHEARPSTPCATKINTSLRIAVVIHQYSGFFHNWGGIPNCCNMASSKPLPAVSCCQRPSLRCQKAVSGSTVAGSAGVKNNRA